jgi:hypothetical protein
VSKPPYNPQLQHHLFGELNGPPPNKPHTLLKKAMSTNTGRVYDLKLSLRIKMLVISRAISRVNIEAETIVSEISPDLHY